MSFLIVILASFNELLNRYTPVNQILSTACGIALLVL